MIHGEQEREGAVRPGEAPHSIVVRRFFGVTSGIELSDACDCFSDALSQRFDFRARSAGQVGYDGAPSFTVVGGADVRNLV